MSLSINMSAFTKMKQQQEKYGVGLLCIATNVKEFRYLTEYDSFMCAVGKIDDVCFTLVSFKDFTPLHIEVADLTYLPKIRVGLRNMQLAYITGDELLDSIPRVDATISEVADAFNG
jgi:hypothetical protein